MRKLLSAAAAALLLVSCSNGRETDKTANDDTATRDLNLASQASTEPLVVSAVERHSLTRPASKAPGKVKLVTPARTEVPQPKGEETIATAVELAPAPAAEVLPEAPAAPPVETPVAAGAGHALAPGQTVSSIPAVAMGSGDPPVIQTIARGGTGFRVMRPDDTCAPHGGVIAINRVYPSQPGFRRF